MGNELNKKGDLYNTVTKYYCEICCAIIAVIAIWLGGFGHMSDMNQRCGLVTLLCPTVFLLKPLTIGKDKKIYWWTRLIDVVLAVIVITSGIYMMIKWPEYQLKATAFSFVDQFMGWALVFAMLEATRRATGNVVAITCLVFLLYTHFGYIVPGTLGHRGESWYRIISTLYVSTEGLFGSSVGVAASFIILFVVFGSFLEAFGTGQWFVDFSYSLTGRFRGGPAKTAIVASGLMGMISGASAANVVTTGSFTIPLMKRMGYKPHEAAAIEAVASTGGMLMPPIMGSAAFLMADIIGVNYSVIARSAIIIAVLYYVTLLLVADAIAVKRNLKGLPKSELPNMKDVMGDRGIFVIPILLLIIMILMGFSASKACVYSIGMILLVACFKKETRPNFKTIWRALSGGPTSAISIVCICSAAGIIVSAISLTGLGIKISRALMTLSGGNLLIGGLIAAIICIILGCGMPCAAVYIILANILSKPLIEMGAMKLAAHMFIFYFSCIGTITPPVAITAYAGAGIAKADPNKTGWTAFRYGLVAYILPFFCLVNPTLLLIGNPGEIILSVITALFGVICLVAVLEGFFVIHFNPVSRVILIFSSLLTLAPGLTTDIAGVASAAVAVAVTLIGDKIKKKPAETV